MSHSSYPFENLSDQELESLAQYEHPVNDEKVLRIQELFDTRRTARQAYEPDNVQSAESQANPSTTAKGTSHKNRFLVAVIAAAVFLLVGFMNADRIYELYYQYFGKEASIAEYADNINESTTDQGIKMEVLSVVNSGSNTFLFINLTDETGDRLSENAFIADWGMTGSRSLGGGGTSLVEYNPDTKTATFAVFSNSANPGDNVEFSLTSFMSGREDYRIVTENIDIAKLLDEHEGQFYTKGAFWGGSGGVSEKFREQGRSLGEITEILEADAFNREIPGCDKVQLSNIAYRDGCLHVQIKKDPGRGNETIYLALIDKSTGEEVDRYYTLNYGEQDEDGSFDHQEYVFEVDRNALANYRFLITGFSYDRVIEGNWEARFQVPERMDSIVKQVDTSITLGGTRIKLESVMVSPLGITVKLSQPHPLRGPLTMSLVYQDGSTAIISDGEANTGPKDTDTYEFIMPIRDFNNIDHLDINGTIIDLR